MAIILGSSQPSEPSVLTGTTPIDALLTELDDELHGRRTAFSEAQKIRRLNKAKDELWKVLKNLGRGYFVVASQSDDPGAPDYLPPLEPGVLEYPLPTNFAEPVMFESTGEPVLCFRYAPMRGTAWRMRRSLQSDDSSTEIHFDVLGPGLDGRWRLLLSRSVPAPATVRLWYVRYLPDFSVPKNANEHLAAVAAPFRRALVTYATKSLLLSERPGGPESVAWEADWVRDLLRLENAAHEAGGGDATYVEDDTLEP